MNTELKVIKLINGDEIFAKICVDDLNFHDEIQMFDPYVVEQAYRETGESYMILTPYIPFKARGLTLIKKSMILTMFDADAELAKFYENSIDAADYKIEINRKQLKQANQDFVFLKKQRESMKPIFTKAAFYAPYSKAVH